MGETSHEKREWKTKLVGVTFDNRQEAIENHARMNSRYRLVRQPDNKFDSNAVMVTANGRDIGYVPGRLAAELAPIIDNGTKLKVHFLRKLINEKDLSKPTGIMVRIWE